MPEPSGTHGALYKTRWDALRAAANAAGAVVCGSARPHPSNRRMAGRTGYGLWVNDYDDAEKMAEGPRLTGYEVVLLPGFSIGVVILDPSPSAPERSS